MIFHYKILFDPTSHKIVGDNIKLTEVEAKKLQKKKKI